jgi:ribosomal protein L1
MVNAKKIYIEKESVDNIIASQNVNYVKFKISYVNERKVVFGKLDMHDEKIPQNYKRLIKWIKFNKWLYETMVRKKVVDFVPELALKVYSRVGSKIFGLLSK